MKQDPRPEGYPLRPLRADLVPMEEDDDDGIDLRAIARKLWRGKWIIAVTTLLAWLLGFLAVSQYEPVYRASAKVMFNLERTNIVDVEDLVVSAGVNENTLQNQIEILRSNALLERVVAKLSLERDPEFNPLIRVPEETLFTRVRSFVAVPPELAVLLQNIGVLSPPPPPAPEPDPEMRADLERRLAISSLAGRLGLAPVPGTRVIQISVTADDPRTAATVVNAVAEQYIVDQLDAKLEATRAATVWLAERVEELRVRLQSAEEAVESARAALSEEAGQGLEITQQQVQAASGALTLARSEARAAQATYDRLSGALARDEYMGAVPEFRSSEVSAAFRAEVAQLELEIARYSEGNPRKVAIERRLTEIRNRIRVDAQEIVEASRSDLASKQERAAALAAEVRALETKALDQSKSQVEIRQLEREAQASRALYENFLGRLEETTAQQDLEAADARILSAAEPPLSPLAEAGQRTKLMLIALGVMSGVGIVFLLDKLNNTFRSPGQLEDLTGQQVLGTVPTIGRRFHKADVLRHFKENPRSSLAESIRSLRTSILFSNVDDPPKVVMFTSSVPGEGKSTTSLLIATTSRQMGKSAIIVDCDLRLPALARLLRADDDSPGLLSLIEGTATLQEAIFKDPATGLDVLMTKPSEPRSGLNAADILASNRFRELIAQLREAYDLVILDTPPALVVADARILSRHADAVVYVVRWDKTPRGAVQEGLKEMRTVNAPIAGAVLTMINEERAMKYSYEGYSYYKGRYKDYYVS
jgi:polysaccharide biosynthesis transport protein